MARLVGRIARGQVVPRGAGAQHPEHAIQHGACVGPGTPPPIGAAGWPEQRLEDRPLRVSEVHAVEYDGHRNFVHDPVSGFMR